mgnify:CR=1 FL=1
MVRHSLHISLNVMHNGVNGFVVCGVFTLSHSLLALHRVFSTQFLINSLTFLSHSWLLYLSLGHSQKQEEDVNDVQTGQKEEKQSFTGRCVTEYISLT